MPTYHYSHESLVDSVHLLTNEKGGLRAYLYADNGADNEKLRLLKQSLRAQGYTCVPTLYKDKPVLEVRGFNKPDELMGYLAQMHVLKGTPQIKPEEGDKRTRQQKMSNATLKMAGLSFNIGDTAYMWYTAGPIVEKIKEEYHATESLAKGFKKASWFDWLDIASGVGYGLGSTCLTFFGSKDQSINTITNATSKIERFARKEGYQVAPESSIAFVNEKQSHGVWGNIKHLVGRYPSESMNAIYVGVGACITAAAFHHATVEIPYVKEEYLEKAAKAVKSAEVEVAHFLKINQPKKAAKVTEEIKKITGTAIHKEDLRAQRWDAADVGLGMITASSAIAGLAIKERKPVEGDVKRHGLGGVVDWIREQPLRATGYGYMAATLCHGVATAGKWNKKYLNGSKNKYLVGRAIFVATNLISEQLLTMSSKGHGVGVKPDSSVDGSILSTAAELVLRQPADKRDAIISRLSRYIASPEVLAVKAETIEKSLREFIAKLDQNPWTKHYTATASGEMVEVAPQTAAALIEQSAQLKPPTVVTNPKYIAKQQATEHALA